jgi:osmotically-inducible protein OsmY
MDHQPEASNSADEPSPNSLSANERARRAVYHELESTGHRELRGVTVEVHDDRIVLSGLVPTYFLKQVAQEATRRACLQRRVYNELDVS